MDPGFWCRMALKLIIDMKTAMEINNTEKKKQKITSTHNLKTQSSVLSKYYKQFNIIYKQYYIQLFLNNTLIIYRLC